MASRHDHPAAELSEGVDRVERGSARCTEDVEILDIVACQAELRTAIDAIVADLEDSG